jgi:hypothetical protein
MAFDSVLLHPILIGLVNEEILRMLRAQLLQRQDALIEGVLAA